MAIFLQQKEDALQWGIWKIDETVEMLLDLLPTRTCYEQKLLQFGTAHRKQEWLSVRVLLYQLLGEEKEIGYQSSGKPFLMDHSFFISISHTKGYVAVALSTVQIVGIDIEQYGQRIHKVAPKFMRADELPAPFHGDSTWSLLLHWSAKEVLFKCMNTAELDFRKHLYVEPFVPHERGCFRACEYKTEQQRHFLIHYLIHPNFVLTWQ